MFYFIIDHCCIYDSSLSNSFFGPSVNSKLVHGRFEGISWNSDETLIAYVAEEPEPSKPKFTAFGYKKGDTKDKDFGCWKGQGDWEEDWGETYEGKRQPALFIINISRFLLVILFAYHCEEGVC